MYIYIYIFIYLNDENDLWGLILSYLNNFHDVCVCLKMQDKRPKTTVIEWEPSWFTNLDGVYQVLGKVISVTRSSPFSCANQTWPCYTCLGKWNNISLALEVFGHKKGWFPYKNHDSQRGRDDFFPANTYKQLCSVPLTWIFSSVPLTTGNPCHGCPVTCPNYGNGKQKPCPNKQLLKMSSKLPCCSFIFSFLEDFEKAAFGHQGDFIFQRESHDHVIV